MNLDGPRPQTNELPEAVRKEVEDDAVDESGTAFSAVVTTGKCSSVHSASQYVFR